MTWIAKIHFHFSINSLILLSSVFHNFKTSALDQTLIARPVVRRSVLYPLSSNLIFRMSSTSRSSYDSSRSLNESISSCSSDHSSWNSSSRSNHRLNNRPSSHYERVESFEIGLARFVEDQPSTSSWTSRGGGCPFKLPEGYLSL